MASYGTYHFGVLNQLFKSIKKLSDRSKITNKRLTKVEANVKGLPVGTIVMWCSSDKLPDGKPDGSSKWMFCHGQALKIVDYPELSPLFPPGPDWLNEFFAIPDFRGRYARFIDYRKQKIGHHEEDTIQNVIGSIGWTTDKASGGTSNPFYQTGRASSNFKTGGGDNWRVYRKMDLSRSIRTSDETRPKTVYVQAVIKVAN